MVVGRTGCAGWLRTWPKACVGVTVPISNNETTNTTETRLASFASLICEFYLPVPKMSGEVAAEVTRFTSVGHRGPRAAVSTILSNTISTIQTIQRSCQVRF